MIKMFKLWLFNILIQLAVAQQVPGQVSSTPSPSSTPGPSTTQGPVSGKPTPRNETFKPNTEPAEIGTGASGIELPLVNPNPKNEEKKVIEALSNAMLDFSERFYVELSKRETGNFVFSPLSLHSALSLMALGSTENSTTRTETLSALGGITNTSRLMEAYRNILNNSDPDHLAYGNHIWVNNNVELQDKYKEKIKSLDAQISSLNMADQSSLNAVNDWVAKLTRNKIPQVLSDLPSETQVLITNALYIKEAWTLKFREADKREFFRTNETKPIDVNMMERFGTHAAYGLFKFGAGDLKHKIVRIPYEESDFEMQVILPNEKIDLGLMEKYLDDSIYQSINEKRGGGFRLFKSAKDTTRRNFAEVRIKMPKFNIETDIDASQVLKKLNVKQVFSAESELGEMVKSKNLKVDKVVHKALVNVDYEGTEGAASTAINIVPLSANFGDRVEFIADRPFMFLVFDKVNNIPILVGRVVNPQQIALIS